MVMLVHLQHSQNVEGSARGLHSRLVQINIVRVGMPRIDDPHKQLVCGGGNILHFSRIQHLAPGAWGVPCLRPPSRVDNV
jgi:hypothetical protein